MNKEDVEYVSRQVVQEELGEVQVALTNCLEEIINPVNYRATVAFSLMDMMYKYLLRDPKFFDYLQAEIGIAELEPERTDAVYEWLQRIKGPDGSVQGSTGHADRGEDE